MIRNSQMDFALTEEQQILQHSIERLFADHYAFDARKRYMQEPERLEPGDVEALRRAWPPWTAVRRRARRLRPAGRSRP